MKTQIIIALFSGLLFSNSIYSQRGGTNPPSMEAASIGIYADVPVNLSKGTLNVEVPIHTISIGNENFPIGLSYNASGIKVDQTASSVGLGWALRGTPMVTRVVKGLPDDIYNSPPVDLIINPTNPNPNYYKNRLFMVYPDVGYFYSKSQISTVKDISGSSFNLNGSTINYTDTPLTASQKKIMQKLSLKGLDSEPDEFYFDLFDVSGKFVFDADKNIHMFTKSPVSIVPTITTDGIQKFTITTPSGAVYHFEDKEITQDHNMNFFYGYASPSGTSVNSPTYKYCNYYWYCFGCAPKAELDLTNPAFNLTVPTSIFYNYDPRQKSPSYTSTWRVTKIEIPGYTDVVFNYESRRILNFSYGKSLESNDWRGFGNYPENTNAPTYNDKRGTVENYSVNTSITEEKFITNINWHTGNIIFNHADRLDIPNINITANYNTYEGTVHAPYQFISDKSIMVSGITVNDMVKGNRSFDFSYNYFLSPCQTSGGAVAWSGYCKRLKLEQIKLHDNSNYKFEYEEQYQLPRLFSLSKDFWGYYNGAINTDEIPTMYYYPSLYGNLQNSEHFSTFSIYPLQNQGSGLTLTNANMVPNINYAKTGMLKKITYPTKGYSEFEYELNTFLLEGVEKPGPGLRIKKVRRNNLISPLTETTYTYKASNGLGSGNLQMLPVFAQLRNKPISADGSSTNISASSIRQKAVFYSASNTMGRTHSVDYSHVTVATEGNGREEYIFDVPIKLGQKRDRIMGLEYTFDIPMPKFKISKENCRIFINGTFSYSNHFSTTEVLDYFPFAAAPNYSWNTGQLLEKQTYDSSGKKIATIKNTYTISDVKKLSYFKTAISYAHQYKPGGIIYSSPESSGIENETSQSSQIVSSSWEHWAHEPGTYDYYFTNPYYISASKNLTKTEETNYLNNGEVKVTKERTYGTDTQLRTETVTTSQNGEKNKVSYKYITDFGNSAAFGTTAIGKPVEILYEKILPENSAQTVILSGEVFQYANNRISKHYRLAPDRPLFRNIANPGLSGEAYYKNLQVSGSGTLEMDPSYKQFSNYLKYDSVGNCLEFTTDYGETKWVYVFGYYDKLLVAMIQNASYSQVQAVTDLSALRISSGNALKQYLNAIRSGLPSSMITTYYYLDSSSGTFQQNKLESITDPSGKSVFYNYHTDGRLKFVKDHNGFNLEEFNYNLRSN